MANIRNKVILIGRLGADPKIVTLDSEQSLANFRLATNDVYIKDDGEKIQNTQWHSIVVWGKLVDITSRFLKKGTEVAVEGKIIYKNYDDKEGITRYVSEIVVHDIQLLGSATK